MLVQHYKLITIRKNLKKMEKLKDERKKELKKYRISVDRDSSVQSNKKNRQLVDSMHSIQSNMSPDIHGSLA